MNKTYVLILLALIFTITFCSKKSTAPEQVLTTEDILVKNNDISGWIYGSERWVANNITELESHINGEAEIYRRYGFVDAAHQTYEGNIDNQARQLKLYIYQQQNEESAKSVFEDPDLGLGSAINWENGAGNAAKYIRFGLSQILGFYKGSYFVLLRMDYDTEESLTIVQQFALNVDRNIK